MLVDYHLHSNYSADGSLTMAEICQRAIKLGIKEIAITDHVDKDWPDPDLIFDIPDLDDYFRHLNLCKDKFQGLLSVKKGIEIGLQPHVLEETEDIVRNHPLDFVIGSIHIINRMDPYKGGYYVGKSKEETYELYYKEILKLLENYDDFDVLGHIGYIKRYSPFLYEKEDEQLCFDIVEDILKTVIDKGKGIEVNTSGFAHISRSPMPTFAIIKRYKELGGEIITVGSDGHHSNGIGYGIPQGLRAITEAGFDYITTFEERRPIFNPI